MLGTLSDMLGAWLVVPTSQGLGLTLPNAINCHVYATCTLRTSFGCSYIHVIRHVYDTWHGLNPCFDMLVQGVITWHTLWCKSVGTPFDPHLAYLEFPPLILNQFWSHSSILTSRVYYDCVLGYMLI